MPILPATFSSALRRMGRRRGLSAAIVLVLALGIGGVTALFGAWYAIGIRPLAYGRPEQLVLARSTIRGRANPWSSGPDYADFRDQLQSFSALEAVFSGTSDVTVAGSVPERARLLLVSGGLFRTLGVKMALGRDFPGREGGDVTAPLVLSHDYWRRHFASRPEALGGTLVLDGVPHVIVGVAPRGFHLLHETDFWAPMVREDLGPRRFNNWHLLGRLKEGVSLARAQGEATVLAAHLEQAYPDTNAGKSLLLTPLQEALAEDFRSSFLLLGWGSMAILLIAWANAAGLIIASGAERRGEWAIRTALGASRWEQVRLFLAEALLYAGLAGILGTLLSVGLRKGLLLGMAAQGSILEGLTLSFPVLLFTFGLTAATCLFIGILPAWRMDPLDLSGELRASGRGLIRGGALLRRGLVAGQIAISFCLLLLAGLLMRSFLRLVTADPGFRPGNLLTLEVVLPRDRYAPPRRTALLQAFQEAARGLPGVTSVSMVNQLPIRKPFNNVSIHAAYAPPADPRERGDGYFRVAFPRHFATLGIPLLSGRDFGPADQDGAGRVAILSQSLARQLFPGRSPLGEAVVIDGDAARPCEVIGVVGDVKQDGLRTGTARGTFYLSYGQWTPSSMQLAVRTQGDPMAILPALRELMGKLDGGIPLADPMTMEEVLAGSTHSERGLVGFLAAFSILAVLLAAVGIHGLLARMVAQRRREIGIRMALGASRTAVFRLVLREACLLGAAGLAGGWLLALAGIQLIRSWIFGVGGADPAAAAGALLLLLGTVLAGTWFPMVRAARVEPLEALRSE